MLAGIIDLKVVLSDGDGDTATDKIDLGSLIKFEDDGPAVDINVVAGAKLVLDESLGTTGSVQNEGGVGTVYNGGIGCRGGRSGLEGVYVDREQHCVGTDGCGDERGGHAERECGGYAGDGFVADRRDGVHDCGRGRWLGDGEPVPCA